MHPEQLTATLVAHAQQGDPAAADKLARELRPHLNRFFRKRYSEPERVEDAVQAAFIRIFQNLGSLRDPEAVRSWALQVASKVYVDQAGCAVQWERKPAPESTALPDNQFSGRSTSQFTTKTLPLIALEALDEDERESIPDSSMPMERRYIEQIEPANRVRELCRSRSRDGDVFLAVYEEGLSHKEAQDRFELKSEGSSRVLCFRLAAWLKPQMVAHLAYA